jgi:hypothetical protein
MSQEATLDSNRSCSRCHKSDLCKIFDQVVRGVCMLPNEGNSVSRELVYIALANCCSRFQNVQKFKSGGPEPI